MTIRSLTRIALTFVVFAALANAQTPPSAPGAKATGPAKLQHTTEFPLLQENSISMIVNAASDSIARHYDLTPEQSDFAKKMMDKNVFEFVNKHFDTLSTFIPKLIEVRTSQRDPSPEEVAEMANKVGPMLKEGMNLMVSQNEEFDKILTDEQRVKHAKDMAEMKKGMVEFNETLTRWQKGGYKPGEIQHAAQERREERRKQRAQRKAEDQAPQNYEPTSLAFWELYLKTFIEAYQLNEGQKTFAYSVFAQARTKAEAYRKDHNAEIVATKSAIISAKVATASAPADKEKAKKLTDLEKKLETLNKPLMDIFDELQAKLMEIPTPEQIAAAEKASEEEQQATSTPAAAPAAK